MISNVDGVVDVVDTEGVVVPVFATVASCEEQPATVAATAPASNIRGIHPSRVRTLFRLSTVSLVHTRPGWERSFSASVEFISAML